MVHIKPMLALALMAGLTLPARSNADVEVVTTRGICTEFGFAAKPSQCSRLVSIHTVHSRRTTFTIAGPSLAIGFAGSQDLRLAPDGYLLLIGSQGTHGIAPSLYSKLPYDPVKDFEHVSILAVAGFMLVVHPSVPVTNLKDLIALAKKSPGKLNYASVSGSSQLMSEMINNMAGIRTVPIPYKGAVPATVAVIGGEADFLIHSFSGLMPLVQAGKLRPLGVTTEKRSPVAPDIPTISEAGLPGYSATSWFSLLAPAATPREVVMRLNQAIVKGLKSKETIDSFASMNVDIMPLTPEQSADWARNEVAKWAKVVKAAGIQPIEQ